MTPDQIKKAAIEAAALALRRIYDHNTKWEDLNHTQRMVYLNEARAAIDAYEAAMWQDATNLPPHHGHTVMMKCASGRMGVAVCVWERATDNPSWHWADVGINEPGFQNRVVPDRYRPLPLPLPQPLEVKHEPA